MRAVHGTADRRRDALALLALIALITLLFADVLFLGQTIFGRDLGYHVPVKQMVREAMLSGQFPYWNRLLEAGQPLAANPAYELFYPPQWLLLLPGFALGYKLHIVLHVYLAAIGMYCLARALRTGITAALFAAISFALGGPMLGLTASFLPFLFAMTWLPWIALFAVRYHGRRRAIDFALAALCLGMQFLVGEPVLLMQTIGLLIVATLFLDRRRLPMLGALLAAGFLVGAVQMLPAIDHVGDSVRARPLAFSHVSLWSMPPARIIEPFFPRFAGAPDPLTYEGVKRYYDGKLPYVASLYAGLLTAVLVLAGIVTRRRGWIFVVVMLTGSYLVAIGDHTPLLRVLYELGPMRSVRYPEKFVLIGGFVAVVFAARLLDDLLRGDDRLRRASVVVAAVAGALALAMAVVTMLPMWPGWFESFWQLPHERYLAAGRAAWLGVVLRALLLVALLAAWNRSAVAARAAALVLLFVVADLLPVTYGLVTRASDRLLDPPPLAASLAPRGQRTFHETALELGASPNELPLSLYDVLVIERNALSGYWAMAWGHEAAITVDFDETNLAVSRRFRDAVVVALQQKAPSYPRQFMSMANATVRFATPERREVLRRLKERGEEAILVDVVREPIAAPRYRFATSAIACTTVDDCVAKLPVDEGAVLVAGTSFRPAPATIERVAETQNEARLVVNASGAALLVASVTDHKYWDATIDGRSVPIGSANLAFQGVLVPKGRHEVIFRYRNPLVAIGAALTCATLLVLALFVAYDLRRAKADH